MNNQRKLVCAARDGDISKVNQALARGTPVDFIGDGYMYGRAAIHHASARGHLEIVRILIRSGANLALTSNYSRDAGATAVHLAAEGGYSQVVRELLKYGMNAEVYDNRGYKPVHRAAKRGHRTVLEVLRDHGCDLSAQGAQDNATTLHCAACHGNVGLVKWLVKNGVSPALKDKAGNTAERYAKAKNHRKICAYLYKLNNTRRPRNHTSNSSTPGEYPVGNSSQETTTICVPKAFLKEKVRPIVDAPKRQKEDPKTEPDNEEFKTNINPEESKIEELGKEIMKTGEPLKTSKAEEFHREHSNPEEAHTKDSKTNCPETKESCTEDSNTEHLAKIVKTTLHTEASKTGTHTEYSIIEKPHRKDSKIDQHIEHSKTKLHSIILKSELHEDLKTKINKTPTILKTENTREEGMEEPQMEPKREEINLEKTKALNLHIEGSLSKLHIEEPQLQVPQEVKPQLEQLQQKQLKKETKEKKQLELQTEETQVEAQQKERYLKELWPEERQIQETVVKEQLEPCIEEELKAAETQAKEPRLKGAHPEETCIEKSQIEKWLVKRQLEQQMGNLATKKKQSEEPQVEEKTYVKEPQIKEIMAEPKVEETFIEKLQPQEPLIQEMKAGQLETWKELKTEETQVEEAHPEETCIVKLQPEETMAEGQLKLKTEETQAEEPQLEEETYMKEPQVEETILGQLEPWTEELKTKIIKEQQVEETCVEEIQPEEPQIQEIIAGEHVEPWKELKTEETCIVELQPEETITKGQLEIKTEETQVKESQPEKVHIKKLWPKQSQLQDLQMEEELKGLNTEAQPKIIQIIEPQTKVQQAVEPQKEGAQLEVQTEEQQSESQAEKAWVPSIRTAITSFGKKQQDAKVMKLLKQVEVKNKKIAVLEERMNNLEQMLERSTGRIYELQVLQEENIEVINKLVCMDKSNMQTISSLKAKVDHLTEHREQETLYTQVPCLGLPTAGFTSYATSVLHCFFNITSLREYFTQEKFKEDLNYSSEHQGEVAICFAKVMSALASNSNTKEAMQIFKEVIETQDDNFQGHKNRAPQGFLISLLTWLHQDLIKIGKYFYSFKQSERKDGKNSSIISRLFHGVCERQITCTRSNIVVSRSREPFTNLIMIVTSENCSLQDLLRNHFKSQDSDWLCPACGYTHQCRQDTRLARLPHVLTVHLYWHNNIGSENNKSSFPTNLILHEHTMPHCNSVLYKLNGVCGYHGSMTEGHYTAYCHDPADDSWKHFDNEVIQQSNLQTILTNSNAQILFYVGEAII